MGFCVINLQDTPQYISNVIIKILIFKSVSFLWNQMTSYMIVWVRSVTYNTEDMYYKEKLMN